MGWSLFLIVAHSSSYGALPSYGVGCNVRSEWNKLLRYTVAIGPRCGSGIMQSACWCCIQWLVRRLYHFRNGDRNFNLKPPIHWIGDGSLRIILCLALETIIPHVLQPWICYVRRQGWCSQRVPILEVDGRPGNIPWYVEFDSHTQGLYTWIYNTIINKLCDTTYVYIYIVFHLWWHWFVSLFERWTLSWIFQIL